MGSGRSRSVTEAKAAIKACCTSRRASKTRLTECSGKFNRYPSDDRFVVLLLTVYRSRIYSGYRLSIGAHVLLPSNSILVEAADSPGRDRCRPRRRVAFLRRRARRTKNPPRHAAGGGPEVGIDRDGRHRTSE